VVEVLIQDGEPVEYGQPLVLLDPTDFPGTDKED
jgi:multidrug resistance efflux pump